MKISILMFVLTAAATAKAEVTCYRTPAQAAVQVGQQEGGGFRLETVRRDALGGRNWATVRSCVHPEWPAVVVATSAGASETSHVRDEKTVANLGPAEFVIANGAPVRVFMVDGMARMELTGVAQGSGRVGDRVWVRIAPAVQGSEGRLAMAVVRSAEILEIGQ